MSNFDLTLSPAQMEFVLKPGVTIIQAYEVTNNSSSIINLITEVLPWIPNGTDGSVNYQQATANPNINFSLNNSDLQLGQPFTLTPGSKKQLVLKIKTDPNINLSDSYYTFFISQNENITNQKSNFTAATGKIGSHLLLTVSNTENPKVESEIQKVIISPKIKDVFLKPITFSGKIKNNSDFFFKTDGKITITKNNKTIKELTLDSNNVLNHFSRNITCSDQTCQLKTPLWPGQYQIKIVLNESLNAKSYESSFYVWPISPTIFVLFIIGIILGVRRIRKIIESKSRV